MRWWMSQEPLPGSIGIAFSACIKSETDAPFRAFSCVDRVLDSDLVRSAFFEEAAGSGVYNVNGETKTNAGQLALLARLGKSANFAASVRLNGFVTFKSPLELPSSFASPSRR